MPDEKDCIAVHPRLGAVCRLRVHPPERAHFAAGAEPDGTQWSLFWWRPAAAHTDPRRADQPTPA